MTLKEYLKENYPVTAKDLDNGIATNLNDIEYMCTKWHESEVEKLHLQDVSCSACRELVECADCENKHFKDERVEKKKGAWTTYRCPKCGSESYCRI